jgi:hypothetical protein
MRRRSLGQVWEAFSHWNAIELFAKRLTCLPKVLARHPVGCAEVALGRGLLSRGARRTGDGRVGREAADRHQCRRSASNEFRESRHFLACAERAAAAISR